MSGSPAGALLGSGRAAYDGKEQLENSRLRGQLLTALLQVCQLPLPQLQLCPLLGHLHSQMFSKRNCKGLNEKHVILDVIRIVKVEGLQLPLLQLQLCPLLRHLRQRAFIRCTRVQSGGQVLACSNATQARVANGGISSL